MTQAQVFVRGMSAGELALLDDGRFSFTYSPSYLVRSDAIAVSLTLPLRPEPFEADELFPFFYGLLAEGHARDLQCRLLKIDPEDGFARLLKTAHTDTIGAVTIKEGASAGETVNV